MPLCELRRTQLISASIEEVWRFFSNPANLAKITPPYMKFRVTSGDLPTEISTGQIITYKVSPLLGIPLNWETEISDVLPLQHFVDRQRKGPYKLWKHRHIFEKRDGKVLMTDIVEYELPLGFAGKLAHALWIKNQVDSIFNYRFKRVEEAFNTTGAIR